MLLEADELDCKVAFVLLDKYLVATDNNQCGGVNVSFSGVYSRSNKVLNATARKRAAR